MSKADENTEVIYRRRIQRVCAGGFGSELRGSENYEIRGHALGLEEGLSEAKLSCPLPIPVFSVSPDFVVFPASWSGADASHTSALNTS